MTKTYMTAHINQQGQNLIIVPLDDAFQHQTAAQQNATWEAIQGCAQVAGLAGLVCLVWESQGGFHFLAPQAWHAFFQSIDMAFVAANLNRELTCNWD
jgi:hypothetical protein